MGPIQPADQPRDTPSPQAPQGGHPVLLQDLWLTKEVVLEKPSLQKPGVAGAASASLA